MNIWTDADLFPLKNFPTSRTFSLKRNYNSLAFTDMPENSKFIENKSREFFLSSYSPRTKPGGTDESSSIIKLPILLVLTILYFSVFVFLSLQIYLRSPPFCAKFLPQIYLWICLGILITFFGYEALLKCPLTQG